VLGAVLGMLTASSVGEAAPPPKAAKSKSKAAVGVDLDIQDFALANGLRVYVVEDHSTPMFALHIVYDVGSRDEEEGRTGFAHLFEHMMFKGSQNVPDGGHFKYVLGVGGEMNASTSYDFTNYFDVLPSNYLDMALWLESDRMRSLEVTDENFENQRAAVKEEKAMRMDNVPYMKAFQDFISKIWDGSGYGHSGIGRIEDLNAAETKDVKAFFDRYYAPNNAVMAVVGDVEFAVVKEKVEKYFSEIPRGPQKGPFPPVDIKRDKPLEERVEDKLARTPAYIIGWDTVPEDHPDAYALELLGNVLLRGESSRVGKILKDEKKLVLGAQFFPFTQRGVGLFASFYVPVKGADFGEIKAVLKEEVGKVQKRGISAKELKKAINQKVMDTTGSLGTNLYRAMMIGLGALAHDDPKRVLSDLEKYQAVTRADIRRVAKQYLTDNWLVLEIVPKDEGGLPTKPF
jgi:zinc protease